MKWSRLPHRAWFSLPPAPESRLTLPSCLNQLELRGSYTSSRMSLTLECVQFQGPARQLNSLNNFILNSPAKPDPSRPLMASLVLHPGVLLSLPDPTATWHKWWVFFHVLFFSFIFFLDLFIYFFNFTILYWFQICRSILRIQRICGRPLYLLWSQGIQDFLQNL